MKDMSYDGLEQTTLKAHQRLIKISEKLRQISDDMAMGKSIDPQKIKKLAGSLEYWNYHLLGVGLFCLVKPLTVYGLKIKWIREEKQKDTLMGKLLREQYGEM